MNGAFSHQSQPSGLFGKLRMFDAFPKQRDEAQEFFQKTTTGGIITLAASLFMFILFCSELSLFMRVTTTSELSVDTTRGEQMDIHFDVTFPLVPCSWVSIDAMDVSGETHLEVDHDIYTKRLSSSGSPIDEGQQKKVGPTGPEKAAREVNGTECGSCYGAERGPEDCCNTCAEVREAYRRRGWALLEMEKVEQCHREGYQEELQSQEGEGCHMWGQLTINKVAGNFHIAPGRSYQQGNMHVHDLSPFAGKEFDFSHRIDKLTFGREYPVSWGNGWRVGGGQGQLNPLDKVEVNQRQGVGSGTFQYFLKVRSPPVGVAGAGGRARVLGMGSVVPTQYTDLRNTTISTNQFSVTEHFREQRPGSAGQQLPGVFFFYDLSPIKVRFQEEKLPFLTFVTSACAIVGGVFTVSGIVDAFVYQGQKLVKKKMDLGKQY
ncbi:hypothetical protein N2152v2_001090 [Parachlorella kessleri]